MLKKNWWTIDEFSNEFSENWYDFSCLLLTEVQKITKLDTLLAEKYLIDILQIKVEPLKNPWTTRIIVEKHF